MSFAMNQLCRTRIHSLLPMPTHEIIMNKALLVKFGLNAS